MFPGGAALNTIRVCQWILKSSHPKCTGYIGCKGKDETGSIFQSYSEKDGVRVECVVDPDKPTGVCGVSIYQKERTLVTLLGAGNSFKEEHLDNKGILDLYKNADFVYITGYFICTSIQSIRKVAKYFDRNNKVFSGKYSKRKIF
ncbi:hypothetical protein MHBO_002476 [Bonamia ostreae]|uniref:Adenosine kinase n=1 Tax=Bonamia ostreae TaxID=126728 RepID=A0ABV2AME2_9EUKA